MIKINKNKKTINTMEKADLWAAAEIEDLEKQLKEYEDEKLAQWIWNMR